MTNKHLFPVYTPRQAEEEAIKDLILMVQKDKVARALLLYGEGGVGKSYLLRNLPTHLPLEHVVYLGPIDVDDAEFWSITNLSRFITDIFRETDYFANYRNFLLKIPEVEQEKMGHETVLAHLRKGDAVFLDDYQSFIQQSQKTPVLILDTLEAIRGTDTLTRLLLWLKKLPGTVLILAGRPISDNLMDPAVEELSDKPKIVYETLFMKEFDRQESLQYLDESGFAEKITSEEKGRMALMSKGHPLWLALSIYYLSEKGVPEEVEKLDIKAEDAEWPYRNGALHDAFLRRLVIPYLEGEFWHEAIFRLGIVRRRVNKSFWRKLMEDYELPPEIDSWDEAWQRLLEFPWIRPRANKNYVTLQDALAEELAGRIIPFRDYDKEERHTIWQKAVDDYEQQIIEFRSSLQTERERLDNVLTITSTDKVQDEILEDVLSIDKANLDLFLLQTTQLYYRMLCNYEEGCQRFLLLFDQATQQHQIRFVELLWAEMQRFLPGERIFDPLEDVIKPEIEQFQRWYQNQPKIQFDITTRAAKYLYEIGQAEQSERLLSSLWEICTGNLEWEYHILLLRGNARLRYPGHIQDAENDFKSALKRTRHPDAPLELKRLEGEALSELGYYYRNVGNWREAGDSYLEALRKTPPEDEVTAKANAGIQSQYAYVQALRGLYQDAHEMVDSALEIRRALDEPRFIGMALSVKGEVYRYERRFQPAWEIYKEAESIFSQLDNWGWLGLVRQEMAICLFQAYRTGEIFEGYNNLDSMLEDSLDIAKGALDFCREYSRRSYPSALNRAGRILGIGFNDYDQGLMSLNEGVDEAKGVADGWFWFANLIEYAELCYRAWEDTQEDQYLTYIKNKTVEIGQAYNEYQFSDLRGRWEILQGQLIVHQALVENFTETSDLLQQALEHFTTGYPLIAFGYVGSHGAIALHSEFGKLETVLSKLDYETRATWFKYLNKAWSKRTEDILKDRQESSLLASLNRLFVRFQLTGNRERAEA